MKKILSAFSLVEWIAITIVIAAIALLSFFSFPDINMAFLKKPIFWIILGGLIVLILIIKKSKGATKINLGKWIEKNMAPLAGVVLLFAIAFYFITGGLWQWKRVTTPYPEIQVQRAIRADERSESMNGSHQAIDFELGQWVSLKKDTPYKVKIQIKSEFKVKLKNHLDDYKHVTLSFRQAADSTIGWTTKFKENEKELDISNVKRDNGKGLVLYTVTPNRDVEIMLGGQ